MRRSVLSIAFLVAAVAPHSIEGRQLQIPRSARDDGQLQTPRSAPVASPPIDTLFLKGLKWRAIGPDRGGRTIAVSGTRGRPNEAYFGAVGGGLWKTMDGGNTWAPVTDGQVHSASVGAVAVSETNPDVVYIGMGETAI